MTPTQHTPSFSNPWWLPGGHLQTIYGAFLAPYKKVRFQRQRLNTPDDDFVELDWRMPDMDTTALSQDPTLSHTAARHYRHGAAFAAKYQHWTGNMLLLFHGLEGSSASPYIQQLCDDFLRQGWGVVVAHFRSCSGFPNRLVRAYHSGDIDDVAFLIQQTIGQLVQAQWYAVGVSLGGNALLKTLASTWAQPAKLHAAAAISAPMDLLACGQTLSTHFTGKHIYARYFLKTMKRKMVIKARAFPTDIALNTLLNTRSLEAFDSCYTAPIHGFKDAQDYWIKASSKPDLHRITTPTLIINACNDPLVPAWSLPKPEHCSPQITLHQPQQGGHAGFVSGPFPGHRQWLSTRLFNFFTTSVSQNASALYAETASDPSIP